jgi:hypothetical protein
MFIMLLYSHPLSLVSLLFVNISFAIAQQSNLDTLGASISDPALTINGIPFSTRVFWMRQANQALLEAGKPCTFSAFASVIVNHSDTSSVDGPLGRQICTGVNSNTNIREILLYMVRLHYPVCTCSLLPLQEK